MNGKVTGISTVTVRSAMAAFAVIVLAALLNGCTDFDPIDHTVEKINTDATSYSYNAILANVVHAKLYEPLTFISISTFDGTDTVQGTLGLPSIPFGPHGFAPSSKIDVARDYIIGPNSLSRTGTNVFHLTVINDAASFAALQAPVNPAQIAFFNGQGYDKTLLFFLFVDRIRQIDDEGAVIGQWANDPNQNIWVAGDDPTCPPAKDDAAAGQHPHEHNPYGVFICVLGNLLDQGLTAQIDATVIPTGHSLPPSRLCMDPSIRPAFSPEAKPEYKDMCTPDVPWIETTATSATVSGSSGGATSTAVTNVAPDGSLWVVRQDQAIHIAANGQTASYNIPASTTPTKPYQQPKIAYDVNNQDVKPKHYQLFMRSVYGGYQYLGALLRNDTGLTNVLPTGKTFIKVNAQTDNCFAQIDYRGEHYCAPDDEPNTKIIFGLLQQLQQLDIAAAAMPTNLTVHAVQ
jgi:hypothetical protein